MAKGPGEALAPNEANMTPEQLKAMKHFKDGIKVSVALKDITDIINLPKPPGRHGIMSNCGRYITGPLSSDKCSAMPASFNRCSMTSRISSTHQAETASLMRSSMPQSGSAPKVCSRWTQLQAGADAGLSFP